jgi:hypothetical protein
MPILRMSKHSKNAEDTPEAEIELAAPTAQPEADAQEQNELVRLRGIIFGTLEHDQQELLARLENRITAQAAQTRVELDALVGRLENRIAELDARSTRDQADLRVQMQSQRDLLTGAIEERGEQVTELVNKDLSELRQSKVDRERFSAFLTGLSTHLESGNIPAGPAAPVTPEPEPESESESAPTLQPPKRPMTLSTMHSPKTPKTPKTPEMPKTPETPETKLAPLPPALKPLRLGRPPWHPIRSK